jgi:Pentapeptide repeats (8 copies)
MVQTTFAFLSAVVQAPTSQVRVVGTPSSMSLVCDSQSAAPSRPRLILSQLTAAAAGAAAVALGLALCGPPSMPAHAATMRLPPIDRSDKNRCVPTSSAIGQANAARDSLLDLRECDLRSAKLAGFDLSGAILENATVDGVDLTDAQLSKGYIKDASFKGANFTNAILDRTFWNGSNLSGAVFANAVLSDATFDGANLENTDWSDAYVSDFTQRAICHNPTLAGTNPNGNGTRESLGCR